MRTHYATNRVELGTGEGATHMYMCSLGGFLEEEITL